MRLWDSSATVQWHLMYFDVISRPWTDSSNGWSVPSRAQIFPKSVVVHFCMAGMACIVSKVAPNSLAEDWNRRFPGRAVRKGYRLVKVPRPRFEHGYNSYTRCYKMLQDATSPNPKLSPKCAFKQPCESGIHVECWVVGERDVGKNASCRWEYAMEIVTVCRIPGERRGRLRRNRCRAQVEPWVGLIVCALARKYIQICPT